MSGFIGEGCALVCYFVAKLTVAGGDGGVVAVADGGCCKKRKKGEEICRG
jgi:hypothetical protein